MDEDGISWVPGYSSDECPFPTRRVQLGRIGFLRYVTGLSPSTPSSPALPVRSTKKRRVRRGRLASSRGSSEEEIAPEPRGGQKDGPGAPQGRQSGGAGPSDGGRLLGGSSRGGESPPDAIHTDEGHDDHLPVHAAAETFKSRKLPPRQRTGRAVNDSAPIATLQERKAVVSADRRANVQSIIKTCLRAAAGLMTAAADFRHGGLCGRLVGAPQCRSRVIFCRVGPALVDVVSLWLSPRGKVLCSCRDHTQNVALASTTGRACNCWHAQAFELGMRDLSSERFAIFDALQVKPGA